MNTETIRSRDLIGLDEVMRICGIGKSEIYQQLALENFPKQVKLSARCSRWVRSEIWEWAEQRISERGTGKRGLLSAKSKVAA